MLEQSDDALKGKSHLFPAHILLTLDVRLGSYFQIQPDNAEALAELPSLRLLDPETSS